MLMSGTQMVLLDCKRRVELRTQRTLFLWGSILKGHEGLLLFLHNQNWINYKINGFIKRKIKIAKRKDEKVDENC